MGKHSRWPDRLWTRSDAETAATIRAEILTFLKGFAALGTKRQHQKIRMMLFNSTTCLPEEVTVSQPFGLSNSRSVTKMIASDMTAMAIGRMMNRQTSLGADHAEPNPLSAHQREKTTTSPAMNRANAARKRVGALLFFSSSSNPLPWVTMHLRVGANMLEDGVGVHGRRRA